MDLPEYKYLRIGHIDEGRLCDRLVSMAALLLPGDVLPPRWSLATKQKFIQKHGAGPKWAKTQHYHLYVLDGVPLFRIWTNTKADYAWVDVDLTLTRKLQEFNEVTPVPPGSWKKHRPFAQRFKATGTEDIIMLVTTVRYFYGVDSE